MKLKKSNFQSELAFIVKRPPDVADEFLEVIQYADTVFSV